MVGYNQNMLEQKAREHGFQGDMKDFPKYLEQNQDVARQYFAQQNSDMYQQENIPQFQTGGMVSPAVVYPPGVENP